MAYGGLWMTFPCHVMRLRFYLNSRAHCLRHAMGISSLALWLMLDSEQSIYNRVAGPVRDTPDRVGASGQTGRGW
jgi:hypothetical protein